MECCIAGAGKCKIPFRPEILPTSKRENYTKILDLPSARILILEKEERFVFAVYELANMDRDVNRQVLDRICQKAQVSRDHIYFHMNHVHSTPHGWGPFDKKNPAPGEAEKMEPFYQAILDATETALDQALAGLRPVKVGTGKGVCRSCIVNRNVHTKDGWWIGAGEEGPVDDGIDILRLDDFEGNTVALLYVYNVVPSIYDYSTRDFEPGLERFVSADLAGYANAFIEEEFPGAVAMYLTGAAGDVWPSFSAMYTLVGRGGRFREKDRGEGALALAEMQGDRLGQQVVMAADAISCQELAEPIRIAFTTFTLEGKDENGNPQEMHPVKKLEYESNGKQRTVDIPCLFIGKEAVYAGFHCQLGVRTIMDIKGSSPYPVTGLLSFTTVEGHDCGTDPRDMVRKYIPEQDAFDRFEYCAQNSVVMPGSAEILTEKVSTFLKEEHRS